MLYYKNLYTAHQNISRQFHFKLPTSNKQAKHRAWNNIPKLPDHDDRQSKLFQVQNPAIPPIISNFLQIIDWWSTVISSPENNLKQNVHIHIQVATQNVKWMFLSKVKATLLVVLYVLYISAMSVNKNFGSLQLFLLEL
jgi:hypothetical protein